MTLEEVSSVEDEPVEVEVVVEFDMDVAWFVMPELEGELVEVEVELELEWVELSSGGLEGFELSSGGLEGFELEGWLW